MLDSNKTNHLKRNSKNNLYCFYKNKYIVANNYEVVEQKDDETLSEFLHEIEKNFSNELKILQIPFENGFENFFTKQISLYPEKKACVYILNNFNFIESIEPSSSNENEKKLEGLLENLQFKALISSNNFFKNINFIKNEIKNGRLYQVNFTTPFLSELLSLNSSELEYIFKFFQLKFKSRYPVLIPAAQEIDKTILSFSPELFLRRENDYLITQPIKGSTHPLLLQPNDLIQSKKEQSELSMIVDLLRNDLNSIEEYTSSEVTKHRNIMNLKYINHTYSEIRLKSSKNLSSILPKMLPGGSISGCPKIESLKLISETEKYKRQIYTGILGWWQNNNFELNLSIRSFIYYNDHFHYHAGCGIVYDSIPEHEWQELIAKTGHLKVTYDI